MDLYLSLGRRVFIEHVTDDSTPWHKLRISQRDTGKGGMVALLDDDVANVTRNLIAYCEEHKIEIVLPSTEQEEEVIRLKKKVNQLRKLITESEKAGINFAKSVYGGYLWRAVCDIVHNEPNEVIKEESAPSIEKVKAQPGDLIVLTDEVCYGTLCGLVEAPIGRILKVTSRNESDDGVETDEGILVWDKKYKIHLPKEESMSTEPVCLAMNPYAAEDGEEE